MDAFGAEEKMNYSSTLKERIKLNVLQLSMEQNISISQRDSAVIFNSIDDNFLISTYENIKRNSNWFNRTKKIHSYFKDGTLEMQSSNSSDAILMNIFCHPKFSSWIGPQQLLQIDKNEPIIF
jgi:hypothetical protein